MVQGVLAGCLHTGFILEQAMQAVYHGTQHAFACDAYGFNEPGDFVKWTFALVEVERAWHLVVTSETEVDYDEYCREL